MENKKSCPRCGAGVMRSWAELSDEEQEVAKRLRATPEYAENERHRLHRWCTRCWHEESGGNEQRA